MISGWIAAGVLLVVFLMQAKKRYKELEGTHTIKPKNRPPEPSSESGEESSESSREKIEVRPSEAKELSTEKPSRRCPHCQSKGEYYNKYKDYYCWECKEYFKEPK